MKNKIFGISILLFIPFMCATAQNQINIFSLNNSLIDYYNQPVIFNEIACSMDKNAKWEARTQLGKHLIYHYNDPISRNCCLSQKHDYIILQEQSSLPRDYPEVFMESVKLWKMALMTSCNSEAVIVLPMNWAFREADDFKKQSKQLLNSYMNVVRDIPGIRICPIGVAVELLYDKIGTDAFKILYSDSRHPSPVGTYLAACMEYAVIFNEDPTAINYVPQLITEEEAYEMRTLAKLALDKWGQYLKIAR